MFGGLKGARPDLTPTDSCKVSVSYVRLTGRIRLQQVVQDADGQCWTPISRMELDPNVAYELMQGLRWALEMTDFLPTDEDFEAYRQQILENP